MICKTLHPSHLQFPTQSFSNPNERLTIGTIRIRYHSRLSPICIAADAGVERDIAEEVDAVVCALSNDAFGAEDVGAVVAAGTGEDGHVLDHAQ